MSMNGQNPAFPTDHNNVKEASQNMKGVGLGITELDYFAAKIAQGILSNPAYMIMPDVEKLAADSYKGAQAMINQKYKEDEDNS